MMKKLCIIDANQKENISFAPGEFGNRCRTCFRHNGMINIFTTKYQDVFLNQMFPMFSLPAVSVNDGLPQKVCGACAKILFEFYSFKQKVVQLQPLLNVAAKHLNIAKIVQTSKSQDSGVLYNILNTSNVDSTGVTQQQDPLSMLCETIKIDDEDDDDAFGGNEEGVESIVICNEDESIENDNDSADNDAVYDESDIQDDEMDHTSIKEEEIQIFDENFDEQMINEEVIKQEDEKKDAPKVLYCNPTVFKTIAHHLQTAQRQDETAHSFQSDSNEVVNEIVVQGNVIPIPEQLKTVLESSEFPRTEHSRNELLDSAYTTPNNFEQPKNQSKYRAKKSKPQRLTKQCTICQKQVDVKKMDRHVFLHERDKCKKSILLFDPETGEYSCNICQEKFTSESEYLLHGKHRKTSSSLDQSQDVEHDSDLEDVLYKKRQRSKRHPYKAKKIPCNVCGKQVTLHILRDHMNTHTKQLPHMCDICGIKFSFKSSLNIHYKRHGHRTNHVCETCGMSYSTPRKLMVHKELKHQGIVNHTCNVCGKGFYYVTNLKLHMHKHTGEKPYLCSKCGQRFSTPSHFLTHTRERHSDVRPFECKICSRSFAEKYKLNFHTKLHERQKQKGANPRRCPTCNENCKPKLYDEHMKLHDEGYDYICGFCCRSFDDKQSYSHHKKYDWCRRTKDSFVPPVCEYCKKHFQSRAALAIHRRSHTGEKPYKCQLCGKQFSQTSHLNTHLKIHTGVKDFECSYCQKKFSEKGNLKQHVMTHTGETPYKCDVCDKGYVFASRLRRHQKTAHENNRN